MRETIESRNPARPDEVVWRGEASLEALESAVARARAAAPSWARRPDAERIALLERWRAVTTAHVEEIARLITHEMGKTLDESRAEAKLLGEKVTITLDEIARARVRDFTVSAAGGRTGECRFHPFGVMAVIGPFNFPAHLPNGHWVPALMLGNTVVFKPSDKTPAVGELMRQLAREAGFPDGVFEVVQGGASVSRALVAHPGVDGILFTGSWPVGRVILEANLDRPGRMAALELGGSNAVLVLPDVAEMRDGANRASAVRDSSGRAAASGAWSAGATLFDHAVAECVRSAFATTGQRCTCARRIIVHRALAPRFIDAFVERAKALSIGAGDAEQQPFMGPLVTAAAREAVLKFVDQRELEGARVLLRPRAAEPGWSLTPGVVEVDRFTRERDEECFGPVAQISVSASLDDMIAQANATDFGLTSAVFTSDDAAWERCRHELRAGGVNRNCGTVGASGRLPFGGLGRSGNLRPAGSFSVDYCAFPKASLIEQAKST